MIHDGMAGCSYWGYFVVRFTPQPGDSGECVCHRNFTVSLIFESGDGANACTGSLKIWEGGGKCGNRSGTIVSWTGGCGIAGR